MTRRVSLLVLMLAGSIAAVSSAREPAAARQTAAALTVRFIWFSATPKPGANIWPGQIPPVFHQMNSKEGWEVPLTAEPGRFLAALRAAEPRYAYQLHLSGRAAPAADGSFVISEGPRKQDPLGFSARETIRILKRDSATTLRIHRKGALKQRPEGRNGGTTGGGWDNTYVREGHQQPLGRTTAMGISVEPTEKITIYAACFLEEESPSGRTAPR